MRCNNWMTPVQQLIYVLDYLRADKAHNEIAILPKEDIKTLRIVTGTWKSFDNFIEYIDFVKRMTGVDIIVDHEPC